MHANRFIGRSLQQVERFVHERVEPVRSRYQNDTHSSAELHI
jgi:hypothetical protein